MLKKMVLDTQTRLFLLLFANIMLFYHLTFRQELISLLFLLSLLFLAGFYQRGISYSLIYLSCFGLDYLLMEHSTVFFAPMLGFYSSTFRRMLPVFMMGGFFMATTSVSSLIYTLRKWRLPEFIVIPLSVLFRFFPTLKNDYQHIRSAMRLRGIALTNWELVKHPFQTLEYIVVPLLMSASETAVDLSAASLTRGITNPGKRTTITKSGLGINDYLVLLIASIIIFFRGQ